MSSSNDIFNGFKCKYFLYKISALFLWRSHGHSCDRVTVLLSKSLFCHLDMAKQGGGDHRDAY